MSEWMTSAAGRFMRGVTETRGALRVLTVSTVFAAAGATAQAASIPVFNTGFDANGALLASGEMDGNYTLVGGEFDVLAGIPGNGAPGAWLDGGTASRWIGPDAGGDNFRAPGDRSYTYRTTFDMTGLNIASAELGGRWAADNSGLEILLNGAALSFSTTGGFGAWTEGSDGFLITSGFNPGVNTLDFVVRNATGNGDNPTGLRVEFTTNTVAAVPVPPAIALMASGVAALFAASRRRRASAA